MRYCVGTILKPFTIESEYPYEWSCLCKEGRCHENGLSAQIIDCVSRVGRWQSSPLPLDYERSPTLPQQMSWSQIGFSVDLWQCDLRHERGCSWHNSHIHYHRMVLICKRNDGITSGGKRVRNRDSLPMRNPIPPELGSSLDMTLFQWPRFIV